MMHKYWIRGKIKLLKVRNQVEILDSWAMPDLVAYVSWKALVAKQKPKKYASDTMRCPILTTGQLNATGFKDKLHPRPNLSDRSQSVNWGLRRPFVIRLPVDDT